MDLLLGQRASVGWGALAIQSVPALAIVIPTLNERANISILVQRLDRALNGISWEAIFVDDDSADGTIDEVRRIAGRDARIRGVRRISRRGLAGAALEGMLSTSAEFIVVMDGDLQHDETRIAEMLSLLQKGDADVVVASRYCEAGTEVSGLSQMRRLHGWRFLTGLVSFASLCKHVMVARRRRGRSNGSTVELCRELSHHLACTMKFADWRWDNQPIRAPSHLGVATNRTPLEAWQGRGT